MSSETIKCLNQVLGETVVSEKFQSSIMDPEARREALESFRCKLSAELIDELVGLGRVDMKTFAQEVERVMARLARR